MKLILRNQIVKTATAEYTSEVKPRVSRTLLAFALAGAVSGVNFLFQNLVTEQ